MQFALSFIAPTATLTDGTSHFEQTTVCAGEEKVLMIRESAVDSGKRPSSARRDDRH
jgi:hypothetical protein